jgi:hypothetical protein
MGGVSVRAGWAFAAVVLVALTGCAAQEPPGLSTDEVLALQAAELHQAWAATFPGEPIPDIQVQQYSTPETRDDLVDTCVGGFIDGLYNRPPTTMELNRAALTCYLEYPLDPAGDHGYLSEAQLEYGYAYLLERTLPCLRDLGFEVEPPPVEVFSGVPAASPFLVLGTGHPAWSPYWYLAPLGVDRQPLRQAIQSCPPPPGSGWTGVPGD